MRNAIEGYLDAYAIIGSDFMASARGYRALPPIVALSLSRVRRYRMATLADGTMALAERCGDGYRIAVSERRYSAWRGGKAA